MPADDELIPLSALQHMLFCPRQCALIHVEQVWQDNRYTAEGHLLHRRVDGGGVRREMRGDVAIVRGLPIRSDRLKLSGKCDVVEFHRSQTGVSVSGLNGLWTAFPVEYKRGQPKVHDADLVQLCAQAICLEEMLNTVVSRGAIYYGQTRHRYDVLFDDDLRELAENIARQTHALIRSHRTPSAKREKKCESCSLLDICLPARGRDRTALFVQAELTSALED